MSATCPPRHPALRALVLLALFALGLVMQPLASALGELHGALAHGEGISSPANHIDDGHDNATPIMTMAAWRTRCCMSPTVAAMRRPCHPLNRPR